MNRSLGVTISAVAVSVLGALGVVAAIVGGISSIVTSIPHDPSLPRAFGKILPVLAAIMTLLFAAFWAWVLISGINLLRLKETGRQSARAIGILAMCLVAFVALAPAVPVVTSLISGNRENLVTCLSAFVACVVIFALLVWWVRYLASATVRAQFFTPIEFSMQSAAPLPPPPTPIVPPPTSAILPMPAHAWPRRPVSITVIAVLQLVGATEVILSLPFYGFFSFPAPLFGFYLKNAIAVIALLATMGLLAFACGLGLLKLKPWARTLAIAMFSFSVMNSLVTVAVPGGMGRFAEAMNETFSRMFAQLPANAPLPAPPQQFFTSLLVYPMWVGFIFGAVASVVQIYFLITRRAAFVARDSIVPSAS